MSKDEREVEEESGREREGENLAKRSILVITDILILLT